MNTQPVSDAVRQMALELAREYDVRPLSEGEQRPDGYYSVGIYTGGALKKPVANSRKGTRPNQSKPRS
ncbi:MAG: hypothetical protein QOF71_3462 [Candidatus Eremiobacteraeota bacterium]|jgi:hypothetical protein|nr:hypothetical protein [Candidatus Eremiobacteraeota bacterium]